MLKRLFASLYEQTIRITMKDGKLIANVGPGFPLNPVTKDKFQVAGAPVRVTFEGTSNGHPQRMVVEEEGAPEPKAYAYVETANPTPSQLAEYAGTYYSEELDTRYTLLVKDGKLILRRKKFDDSALSATIADKFTDSEIGNLFFKRDSGKRLTGFELNAGRVRHLQFSKEPR